MSRKTIYQDSRLTYVSGVDHMLGPFMQLYDKDLEKETTEGEGLIMDWSLQWGYEINFTGESSELPPAKIARNYIKEHGEKDIDKQ
jgi:hypothetical protein